jgi:hypothetical protein
MCTSGKRRLTELLSVMATSNKSASSHEMPSTLIILKVKFLLCSFLCPLQGKKKERQVVMKPDLNQATQVLTANLIEQIQFACTLDCDYRSFILQDVSLATVLTVKSRGGADLSERKQPCRAAISVHISRFNKEH